MQRPELSPAPKGSTLVGKRAISGGIEGLQAGKWETIAVSA